MFLINPIVKTLLPFHIPFFWTHFIVKKWHHRNKYLGQLILNLYATSKYLSKNNSMMLIHSIKHFLLSKPKRNKQKYIITLRIPKLKIIIIKKFYFFSLQYIRMSGKTINFNDKKIKKSDFYKNKKVFQIENINVNNILVSKKEP